MITGVMRLHKFQTHKSWINKKGLVRLSGVLYSGHLGVIGKLESLFKKNKNGNV